MKVYVVISECGTILDVYKNKSKAEGVVERLETLYEKATIKECKVL